MIENNFLLNLFERNIMLRDGISTSISLMGKAYDCPPFDENIIKRAIRLKESRKFTKFLGITPIVKYYDCIEIFKEKDPSIEELLLLVREFRSLKKKVINE